MDARAGQVRRFLPEEASGAGDSARGRLLLLTTLDADKGDGRKGAARAAARVPPASAVRSRLGFRKRVDAGCPTVWPAGTG